MLRFPSTHPRQALTDAHATAHGNLSSASEEAGRSSAPLALNPPPAAARQISPQDKNWNEVLKRMDHLFRQGAADETSKTALHFYLTHNNLSDVIPPGLSDLMVLIHWNTRKVHSAIPFGRGQVLTRKKDALDKDYKEKYANQFHNREIFFKNYLKILGEHAFAELSEDTEEVFTTADERKQANALKLAACSLLTGSSGCEGYAAMLAILIAEKYAGAKDVSVEVVGSMELNGKILDHALCRVTYTTKDDRKFTLLTSPFDDMNIPILEEHSQYKGGEVLSSFNDLNSAKEKISRYLNKANELIGDIKTNPEFYADIDSSETRILEADARKSYSIPNSFHGYLTRSDLNIAKPDIQVLRRRPSILSPASSSLAPWIKSHSRM